MGCARESVNGCWPRRIHVFAVPVVEPWVQGRVLLPHVPRQPDSRPDPSNRRGVACDALGIRVYVR